jgi:hypothetical protein
MLSSRHIVIASSPGRKVHFPASGEKKKRIETIALVMSTLPSDVIIVTE